MVNFRQYFVKGHFSELQELTKDLQTEEQRYWHFIAAVNLDKTELVNQMRKSFGQKYEIFKNEEYRKNIMSLYQQYSTLQRHDRHYPEPDYGEIPKNINSLLRNLFPNILRNQNNRVNYQIRRDKGIINNNNHIIKFTYNPANINQLKREADLLKSISPHLSLQIPEPIDYASNSLMSGFYYRKIEGTQPYLKEINPKHIINILGELQGLSQISEVKKLLIDYEPEIDTFSTHLTPERMHERDMGFSEEEIQNIQIFIQLCKDHLDSGQKYKTFVHGDLFTNNLLTTDNKTITGIIDFERCWYADPLIDLSKLALQSWILDNLLLEYNDKIMQIDIDHTKGKILLYRGIFILRRLLTEWSRELKKKTDIWILNPVNKIEALLEGKK